MIIRYNGRILRVKKINQTVFDKILDYKIVCLTARDQNKYTVTYRRNRGCWMQLGQAVRN